jgi:hypothetical protein
VKSFIQKYEQDVIGVLSGFDRLVFRGTLRRLLYPQGMDYCLAFLGVLLKDFAQYVLQVTARLKEASLAAARCAGRPIQYLASSQISKEDLARKIAARDQLADGLICVLTCVEPCQTFEIHRHRELFGDFDLRYYWAVHQSEWATDVMFRDPEKLAGLYPQFLRHGLTTFASPDMMRFLGRQIPLTGNLPSAFAGEVVSRLRQRPEGIRIKHWVGSNHIKLYDQEGSNLRVETTINQTGDFKVLRRKEGAPHGDLAWRPLRKGVADLHRRAQVSEAANQRYLEALSRVQDTASLGSLTEKLCRPATWKGKRVRALNPYGPEDLALLQAVARGEFNLNGFRNRDLVKLLYASDRELTAIEKRRQSAAITRKLRLLRAHGLIKKVPKTHRYHLTASGSKAITAIIAALQASPDSLIKLAA